jgi:N-acetyl-gamma-glutamyl-phosphate reductase
MLTGLAPTRHLPLLHEYAVPMYSHTNHDGGPSELHVEPVPGEGPGAPVSAGTTATLVTGRPTGPSRAERGRTSDGGPRRIRVGIIGATGYVGSELVRILARHPNVELAGLQGRDRDHEPIEVTHRHLDSTGLVVDSSLPDVDAVFLALPHGQAASRVPAIADGGTAVIDLGPDFRLRASADYPRWYGFEHPNPEVASASFYGLPELHRAELAALVQAPRAIVGAPGCYPTATLLALAPLARAGLIGDLVIDAKSGVSGAGREAKQELMYGEVNESVKAYGIGGHRHVAEIEQELGLLGGAPDANPGATNVDFLPHLVPMTRGILSACHVRPTRPVDQAELDALYADAYAGEPFVRVVSTPPTTKHVTGSNEARVHVTHDPRTGRILAIGVIDNLVKGAAGQGVQAFNLVHGLPETAGLEQLPLAP